MKRASMSIAACGIVLWIAAANAGPGAPDAPAVQHFESEDQKVAIDLPAEWTIEHESVERAVLGLRAVVPGVDGTVFLTVYNLHGIRGERGQAYRERREQPGVFQVKTVGEVHLDPTPHLVMDIPESSTIVRHVWMFRVIDRDGYSVSVNCIPAAWPSIQDACFRAAASLTSKLGVWPKRPEGYRSIVRDGFEYLLHPKLKDKDIDVLHENVLDQEKRYEKLHGPLPKPPSNQIMIVVTPDNATAAGLSASAKSDSGYAADFLEARIFALPMKKDDYHARTSFVDRVVAVFHVQSMGDGTWDPVWLFHGERLVAAAEAWSGKPLPAMSIDFTDKLAHTLVPFEELTRKPPKDVDAESFAYVAFFRAGPPIYRDAFAAFLKDVAATGDWEAAQKKDLLSLDQDKLHAAAESFLAKDLKFVKQK